MQPRKYTVPAACIALGLSWAAASCVVSGGGDSSLTIANDSSYVITSVYLAAEDDPSWGPDLLPGTLFPGEELTIGAIDCDTYDVLVVDETGVECELSGLDLCFDDDLWVVDDVTLDVCAFGP